MIDRPQKKHKRKPDFLAQPVPAKLDIIKVDRPKPKPLYCTKTTSTAVHSDTPMPNARPLETSIPNHTLTPAQGPQPGRKPYCIPSPRDTKPRDMSTDDLPSLYMFLAECSPRMEHLASAFIGAGLKNGVDLMGMAKWQEERQRKFLKNTEIARTALELEAIVIGLSVCITSLNIVERLIHS